MNQDGVEITRQDARFEFKRLLKRRLPITEWLPRYTLSTFLHDLLAGFTVGLTEVPQGIAYATVAGLNVEYGLYSGFMGCFIYALFGSCKDVNVGPTSIMALMIQPHVVALGANMAVLMAFLAGILILILGLMHMGFVVEFFSYPIISGFTSAAAINIASTQIKSLFGLTGKADAFLQAWEVFFTHLNEIKLWDTVLGISTIIILMALREIRRYGWLGWHNDRTTLRNWCGRAIFMLSLTRNALAVIGGAVIAWALGTPPFAITGDVKGDLPPFAAPPFHTTSPNGTYYAFGGMIEEYGTSIAFIPLIAILESVAIAKAFSKGRTMDATQEMIALGISNIMGSFVSSMPITGSFTRTAVNNSSGVKTPLGGIFTGAMVLLVLKYLSWSFRYIPKATLAAVVICAMFYLFDYMAFVIMWKNKKLDLIPFMVTLLSCLLISLEYGILIGIATNLIFILYPIARPKFDMEQLKLTDNQSNISILTPRNTLRFPAIEYFRDNILKIAETNDIIIINGKYVGSIDITVAKGFCVMFEETKTKNVHIYFQDFKPEIMEVCVGIQPSIRECFVYGALDGWLNGQSTTDTTELFTVN